MNSCAIVTGVWLLVLSASSVMAQNSADDVLAEEMRRIVQPFLKAYCVNCHSGEKQEGQLNLSGYASLAVVAKDHRVWKRVAERLAAEEMPPEDALKTPQADERSAVVEWIVKVYRHESARSAGDPGIVLARRLSSAEFDYTIRDLTGVDIHPTREFPVDPANEAGFDNSGESLTMSPALVRKYLEAVRRVANHLVLKPQGLVFAPHSVVTDTDRDKYCVQRIIDFYDRHRVDYADYFQAAWSFRERAEPGRDNVSLDDFAREYRISARYLAAIWEVLHRPTEESGALHEIQSTWSRLPGSATSAQVRGECEKLRERVMQLRKERELSVTPLSVDGISKGSQALVLWRNRQLVANRLRGKAETSDEERFCRIFPDAFVVSDRALQRSPGKAGAGRPLTAGFHLMQGYFRDDVPLCDLVLDDAERRELDALWEELNFIALAPIRQYKDFIFFERAEPPRFMIDAKFDFARSEDKDSISEDKIEQLAQVYLNKAREIGANDEALRAMEMYFTTISAEIRQVEAAQVAAEPSHLEALAQFTQRAFRRPLSETEREELLAQYRQLRGAGGLSHEAALRDTLAGVLLSPWFLYRCDLAEPGEGVRPLTDFELASRLSYFLWSSLPDEELLARASAGELRQPDVLASQARRMLSDAKISRLATEFAGNWLDFRRFEEHNAVDRERFPQFSNELRKAMFEEPRRFFVSLAHDNRSVLDLLYADDTFVNKPLAEHYGIPFANSATDEWVNVKHVRQYGRGGLLPMAVFLTKNSPGLRTSPVKRGYWVVRRMLGEHIPAPPAEVPELPADEAKLGELTLPEVLARHREHKNCAVCHERFDAIGLTFEGYGPIGERRDKDLGNKPVDTQAIFPDHSTGTGIDGLRRYLHDRRQNDFVENFCQKLFSYALGRGLQLSDEPTVAEFCKVLAANDFRCETLIQAIVASPQFRNKRGEVEATDD